MDKKEEAGKRLRNASAVQWKGNRAYYGELRSLNQVKPRIYSQYYINVSFLKGDFYEGL